MTKAISLITKVMLKIKISQHPNINEILQEYLKNEENKYQNWWDYANNDYDDDDLYDLNDSCCMSYLKSQHTDDDKKFFDKKDIYYIDYMTPYFTSESFKKDVIHFKNVHQLQVFCNTNGINIDKNELNVILNRNASYCTIDPMITDITLMSDSSWVALYYEYTYSKDDYLSK